MKLYDYRCTDGWFYEVYSPDTAADAFGDYAAFKELWDGKRRGELLPAWKDYELTDFAPWYGWVCVTDLLPGPEHDEVYRLWGTELTKLFNVDLTNRRTSEYAGSIFPEDEFDELAEMRQTHNLRICSGPVNWPTEGYLIAPKTAGFIELPLADDGEVVDKYIGLGRAL